MSISKAIKLSLLHDFLSSDYYCDLSVVRGYDEIETIRDTFEQYISWGMANIENISADLQDVINQGRLVISECESLLSFNDFTDLKVLSFLLKDLKILVNKLKI